MTWHGDEWVGVPVTPEPSDLDRFDYRPLETTLNIMYRQINQVSRPTRDDKGTCAPYLLT